MSTQAVGGFTTSDINAASTAAGVGGTVTFGPGTYAADDLRVSVADQTWILDRKALIKRTNSSISTWIILVQALGWRLEGGVLDGNRALNSVAANGISSSDYDVTLRNVEMTNVKHWGVNMTNALLTMRDCKISKTGQACVFWRIIAGSPPSEGPSIIGCTFDRLSVADYIASGGVLIQSQATKIKVQAPIMIGNRVTLPKGAAYAAVGIEYIQCERGIIDANSIYGGRIGLSLGNSNLCAVNSNAVKFCSSYGIELAQGSNDNVAMGNALISDGIGTGVQVSDSARNTVGPNISVGWAKPITLVRSPGTKMIG